MLEDVQPDVQTDFVNSTNVESNTPSFKIDVTKSSPVVPAVVANILEKQLKNIDILPVGTNNINNSNLDLNKFLKYNNFEGTFLLTDQEIIHFKNKELGVLNFI